MERKRKQRLGNVTVGDKTSVFFFKLPWTFFTEQNLLWDGYLIFLLYLKIVTYFQWIGTAWASCHSIVPYFHASEYKIVPSEVRNRLSGPTETITDFRFINFTHLLAFQGSIKQRIYNFFSLTGLFRCKMTDKEVSFKMPEVHKDLIEFDKTMPPCFIDLKVIFGPKFEQILMNYLKDSKTHKYEMGEKKYYKTSQ